MIWVGFIFVLGESAFFFSFMHVLLWLCILIIWLAVCLGWAKTEGIFLKTYFSSHYLIADTRRRSERGHRRIAKKKN